MSRTDPCRHCKRAGLGLVATIYAVVHQDDADALPTVAAPFGDGVLDQPLSAHRYILRTPTRGYVYVLYPGGRWQAYTVDPGGCMQLYVDLDLEDAPARPPEQPKAATCNPYVHAKAPTHAIAVDSPRLVPEVWVAYSGHKWTKRVRRHYAGNLKARQARMTRVDVAAALRGGSGGPHTLPASVENLKAHVADFAEPGVIAQVNHTLLRPLQSLRAEAEGIHAALLRMAAQQAPENQGLIVALHDPVGITHALRASVNAAKAHEAAMRKKYEREDFSARTIRVLEQQAQDSPRFAEAWNTKYAKAIRFADVARHERETEARRDQAAREQAELSGDWLAWVRSPRLQAAMEGDFDPQDTACGIAYLGAVCATHFGAGSNSAEQSGWMPQATDPSDARNYLWRATMLNQTDLLKILTSTDGLNAETGALKGAYGALDEWLKQAQRLAQLRVDAPELVPYAQEPLVKVVGQLYATLQTVMAHAKQRAMALTRAAVLAMYLHGMEVQPIASRQRVSKVIGMQREAVWKPQAALFKVERQTRSHVQWRVDLNGLMEGADVHARAEVRIVQWVITRVRVGIEWRRSEHFTRYEQELAESVEGQRAAAMTPVGAAPPPPPRVSNWWALNKDTIAKFMFGPHIAGTLAAAVGVLQYRSFTAAVESYAGAAEDDEKAKRYAVASMSSATLGMLGAGIEVMASAWEVAAGKAYAAAGEQAVGIFKRRVAVTFGIGGILGAAGGVVAALQQGFQAYDLFKQGDDDASVWLVMSSFATFGSAVASGVAASASAATFLNGAPAVLLGLGPVGWAVVAVGLIAVGTWLLFKSEDAKDDPLERWLKQCAFGIAKNEDWQAEVERREYEKLMEIPWSSTLVWESHEEPSTRDRIALNVSVPQTGPYSVLAYELIFFGAGGTPHALRGVLSAANGNRYEEALTLIEWGHSQQYRLRRMIEGKLNDGRMELKVVYEQWKPSGVRDSAPGPLSPMLHEAKVVSLPPKTVSLAEVVQSKQGEHEWQRVQGRATRWSSSSRRCAWSRQGRA